MKKNWLSLATVLCFGIGLVSGCNKNDNTFKKLNEEGHDVVFKLGDDVKYTADDLFNDMLNSENGVKAAYEKILKMIVENAIETNANMETSWELMLEKFEDEVASKAASEGISKKEARKALLSEEGFASVDEKKESYLYGIKLAKLQEEYWKEKKDSYFNEYFNERMPYYVKHILVKTGYTANRGPYASVIDSDDASRLYKVYNMLSDAEYSFNYVMNNLSEDAVDGKGYHMDLTTSFVTEFLHGVFVIDSLMKDKESEVTGLTSDILSYYVNSTSQNGENDYNFNVIYANDVEKLGEKASSSDYNSISTYEKDDEGKDKSVGSLSNSNAYGSTSSLYTRSIIFNQTFNNPGISVIADDNLPEGRYIELTIDGKKQKLLTDESGNVVFVVCAKGSSSDLWVHFLTVGVSPFDENAKLFFSLDQEKTIEQMVEIKKNELKTGGTMSDADIETAISEYKENLEGYMTYVDEKSGGKNSTQAKRNEIIDELENIVKTYAKRGITSGAVAGKDEFLTYDMVQYYMEKGNVVIADNVVKTLVNTYIQNQKDLIDLQVVNSISNGWKEYYDRVVLANSQDIVDKKIPMECAYGVNNGATCKYYYDEENRGFEIMITYKNVGDSNAYMPTDKTKYTSSFRIGDGVIELPGVKTDNTDSMHRDGYTFDGWYYTSTFDEGTEVTQIDPSRSSTDNKVVLYAKWTQVPTGGAANE